MKHIGRIIYVVVGIYVARYDGLPWNCLTTNWQKVYALEGGEVQIQFNVPHQPSTALFKIVSFQGFIICAILYYDNNAKVGFLRDGFELIGNVQTGEVIVQIRNLTASFTGSYSSYWEIKLDESSICATVYLLGKPRTPTCRKDKDPVAGEAVTLTCSSSSTTVPSNHSLRMVYNWKVDYIINPSDSRYSYSASRDRITLMNVTKEDSTKQFSCTAAEDVNDGYISNRSNSVQMSVIYGPDFVTLTPPTTTYEIDEMTNLDDILCSADCFPECSFRWTKVGQMNVISNTGILRLGKIYRNFTGHYACTAVNERTAQRTQIYLAITVRYAPLITPRFSTPKREEGTKITLYCEAVGVPAVYSYTGLTQTVADVEVLNKNTALEGTPKYSSIHFSSLQLQDSGNYTCMVHNGVPGVTFTMDQTATVELLVEVRPTVLRKSLVFVGAWGGSLTVAVPFYCYPAILSATFLRDDGSIIENSTKYTSIFAESIVHDVFYGKAVTLNGYQALMTIHELQENDFVKYNLVLQNELGHNSFQIFVVQEGVPEVPKGFTVVKAIDNPRIYTFIWEKGFNGGHIQTFIIQVRKSGNTNWGNVTILSEMDTFVKINDTFYMSNTTRMDPGTYSARLIAYNSIGKAKLLYLNGTFTVQSEPEQKHNITPAIAGGISAVGIVIIGITVFGVILFRKGLIKLECVTRTSDEGLNESNYCNIDSRNECVTNDGRTERSGFQLSEFKVEANAYEILQGGSDPQRNQTYDKLY